MKVSLLKIGGSGVLKLIVVRKCNTASLNRLYQVVSSLGSNLPRVELLDNLV